MSQSAAPLTARQHPLLGLLYLGPIALFLAASAWGVLEIHSSTDTWIGLAGGQKILAETDWTNVRETFPHNDTFSYTFNGELWFNQNWLTHVFQYWLYSHVSRDAVVYGTWFLAAGVFWFVLLAAYWRGGSWLGALLAAAVVGLGCRDFLSARPATTGFFCISALWALVCALEGQRGKTRWWPIVLLLPLLFIWGNAHGSFVFGYGTLALYLGYWFLARTIGHKFSWAFSLIGVLILIPIAVVVLRKPIALASVGILIYSAVWLIVYFTRPRVVLRDTQAYAIAGVMVTALALTIVLGPFGLDNFTHGEKVAGSDVFRRVSEWNPPYVSGSHFPPVWRFWAILYTSLTGLLLAGLFWLLMRRKVSTGAKSERPHTSMFDLAMVAIGLGMAFWARRFAPIYFIFGAPVFLTWVLICLRPLQQLWPRLMPWLRGGLMVGAAGLAVFTAHWTHKRAHQELTANFVGRPEYDLLDRVTRVDMTPRDALLYLQNNELEVNLLVEWTSAGVVMFQVPTARVYMDGRAQQVYDEAHYLKYSRLFDPTTLSNQLQQIVQEYNTDAILLRRHGRAYNLWTYADQSPEWVPVLLGRRYGLFLRVSGAPLERVGKLIRSGAEWRPESAWATASEGHCWAFTPPPDFERAIECWQAATERNLLTSTVTLRPWTIALLKLGQAEQAMQMLQHYHGLLNTPIPGIPEDQRQGMRQMISELWGEASRAASGAGAARPGGGG